MDDSETLCENCKSGVCLFLFYFFSSVVSQFGDGRMFWTQAKTGLKFEIVMMVGT